MNDLIKINYDSERPTVSARDLHDTLRIEKRFSAWFETNSQGFLENEDYSRVYLKVRANRYGGEQEIEDYRMSVDMAKHICLMSRTEKGKQLRQYLIDLEKAWNTPEQIMARALKMADREIDRLKQHNGQLLEDVQRMKPKEVFADAVSASKNSILIGDLAKLLAQNGVPTGRTRLFNRLREDGFLMKEGESKNLPTQRAMEMGLFEIKESIYIGAGGQPATTTTTKVTGKGQQYFIRKYLK